MNLINIKLELNKSLKSIKIFRRVLFSEKININIGSANVNPDSSWIATDLDVLDCTKKTDWYKMLLFLKVDKIMAEHVWEHLTPEQSNKALSNCYKFLKKGGTIRIAVPDGYHADEAYIEDVKPMGKGLGSHDHKVLYNYKILSECFADVGFKVSLLEYWDENKKFHYVDWTDENGHIRRSRRYDKRNKDGKLVYTSLIIEGKK
jgi:predicted SAM-dependent methyltransferase